MWLVQEGTEPLFGCDSCVEQIDRIRDYTLGAVPQASFAPRHVDARDGDVTARVSKGVRRGM
ncbi:MAG TPA: hypothetical protein VEF89_32220 [Solirubrobacteraceae bacterium]|nr:hypothetical protein [Solirubrobacteraceae bacterium]